MQFNSYIFTLLFLPAAVIAYFLIGRINGHVQKLSLIALNIVFYSYFGLHSILILLGSVIFNYLFVFYISNNKLKSSCLPIVVNVLMLFIFKYFNFTINNLNTIFILNIPIYNIVLPAGISFITFQQISYISSVKEHKLRNNLIDYLAYILYFPKIIMGPLIEPDVFISQLNNSDNQKPNYSNIACGIKTFSLGLFKKVILADTFAKAVNWGFGNFDTTTSFDWILIALFYTFEIYFDFSGYTDMATGISLMFNIELPINFNSPYKALSIQDFWKRWHISLTSFFTKYIYIPLGGNRNGVFRTCLNIMIIFLISGIWHGSNWTYILWGLLNGILLVTERLTSKLRKNRFIIVNWALTFVLVNILWLLFRSDTIQQWIEIINKIGCIKELTISDGLINVFNIVESRIIGDLFGVGHIINNTRGFWMIAFVTFSFMTCVVFKNNYQSLKANSFLYMILTSVLFAWSILGMSEESIFVYFNF